MPRSIHRSMPAIALAAGAVVLVATGTADAASGGWHLGGTSTEHHVSTLSNKGKGPALSLKVKSSKTAPLKVSNSTEIPKLNSGLVGGFAGTSLAPVVLRSSGSFKVPAGVHDMLLEVYGAGGGGGGSDTSNSAPGGGGAAGGGVTAVVEVSPGQTYDTVVGAAGSAGTADHDGIEGGYSSVMLAGSVDRVAVSPGGAGGFDGELCGESIIQQVVLPGRAGVPPGSIGLQSYAGDLGARPSTCTSNTRGGVGAGQGIVGAGGQGAGDGGAAVTGQPGLVVIEFST